MMTPDLDVALALALLLVAIWLKKQAPWLLRWAALAVSVSLAIKPAEALLHWIGGWFPF